MDDAIKHDQLMQNLINFGRKIFLVTHPNSLEKGKLECTHILAYFQSLPGRK